MNPASTAITERIEQLERLLIVATLQGRTTKIMLIRSSLRKLRLEEAIEKEHESA
jgi:hypothetical protein